jgi:hypothetical protein
MSTDIFLSYCRRDASLLKQIVGTLNKSRLTVWWDEDLHSSSETISKAIKDKLDAVQCVLVLWTHESINSDWAKKANKLVQVIVNGAEPYGPLSQIPSVQTMTDDSGLLPTGSLKEVLESVWSQIGVFGPFERRITPLACHDRWPSDDSAMLGMVPGTEHTVSFRPSGDDGMFLISRVSTTDGWTDKEITTVIERHQPYQADGSEQAYDVMALEKGTHNVAKIVKVRRKGDEITEYVDDERGKK